MRVIRTPARLLGVALFVAACGAIAPSGSAGPDASTGPPPGGSAPTSRGPLTAADLKYRLIEQVGWPWFCDPDEFPVAHGNPEDIAVERFPDVQADVDSFAAIVRRYALRPDPGGWSLKAKMAIYHDWKILNAIVLDPVGDAVAHFDYLQMVTGPPNATGTRTAGTIDSSGAITIEATAPAGEPICPICLARGTPIGTPDGPRAVEDLRPGDLVWTADAAGDRVAVALLAIGSVRAPADHVVVHLVLSDGRALWASPGHPLPDGRRLGDLNVGDTVDGSIATTVDLEPYTSGSTFDVLPAGATGTYWAGGILVRSTLLPQPTAAR